MSKCPICHIEMPDIEITESNDSVLHPSVLGYKSYRIISKCPKCNNRFIYYTGAIKPFDEIKH